MKKTLAFFALLLGFVAMFAQSGATFPYQAVVRNSQNQLIKDSTFAIGVEVYQGADLKFSETQSVTTNANGQFTMNIGGGTVVSGAMNDVTDWSVAKFKITYHLSGGDIVSENAVSPVPYALQAANVAESAGLDCADVKTCIADTLNHYTTTTALEQMLQQISVRMDAQEATIDSLRHLVDSLSDLSHGGGSTPSAIFFCDSSTVKDVDQNVYHTVAIGNQCWMKENLRTKTHTYGNVWTNPDVDSVIYGRYYDWEAVMQVEGVNSSDFTPSGIHQGICPAGWHVPSRDEWDILISHVNDVEEYKCGGGNGDIANALSSTTGWVEPESCCAGDGNSATINKTGFSVVPAGYKFLQTGLFEATGNLTFFGSASQNSDINVSSFHLARFSSSTILGVNFLKQDGISVRCLRDAGIVGNAGSNESGIGSGNTPSTPATMSCEDVIECMGDTLGRLNAKIENLQNTVAKQDSTINALNNQVNPPFTCGTSTVKDVDNNEYNTVQIGNQCWMAQNLRTKLGTDGDKGYPKYPNGYTKAGQMVDDSLLYGRLYTWDAVTKGASTNYPANPTETLVHGICPTGWHVPSDAEWDTLTRYVFSIEDYKCGNECGTWQAQSDFISCIAKALSSTTGWNSNTESGCNAGNRGDKSNLTGFSAVPAGDCSNGCFYDFGHHAYFWSATEYGDDYAWCRSLSDLASPVSSDHFNKGDGYSVRCLRD